MMASIVSAKPAVRNFLLDMQREMGKDKALVCEGRDMGTVIFPEADIKFFLDADPHVRACRRYKEMPPKTAVTLEDISRDMLQRDQNDSRRALAPLKPADDAIRIDCTHIDPQAVVRQMMACIVPMLKARNQKTDRPSIFDLLTIPIFQHIMIKLSLAITQRIPVRFCLSARLLSQKYNYCFFKDSLI